MGAPNRTPNLATVQSKTLPALLGIDATICGITTVLSICSICFDKELLDGN